MHFKKTLRQKSTFTINNCLFQEKNHTDTVFFRDFCAASAYHCVKEICQRSVLDENHSSHSHSNLIVTWLQWLLSTVVWVVRLRVQCVVLTIETNTFCLNPDTVRWTTFTELVPLCSIVHNVIVVVLCYFTIHILKKKKTVVFTSKWKPGHSMTLKKKRNSSLFVM